MLSSFEGLSLFLQVYANHSIPIGSASCFGSAQSVFSPPARPTKINQRVSSWKPRATGGERKAQTLNGTLRFNFEESQRLTPLAASRPSMFERYLRERCASSVSEFAAITDWKCCRASMSSPVFPALLYSSAYIIPSR
jgi:hypothetical protein